MRLKKYKKFERVSLVPETLNSYWYIFKIDKAWGGKKDLNQKRFRIKIFQTKWCENSEVYIVTFILTGYSYITSNAWFLDTSWILLFQYFPIGKQWCNQNFWRRRGSKFWLKRQALINNASEGIPLFTFIPLFVSKAAILKLYFCLEKKLWIDVNLRC